MNTHEIIAIRCLEICLRCVQSSSGPLRLAGLPPPNALQCHAEWMQLLFLKKIIYLVASGLRGFPGGASGKEPACQCRRQEMRVPLLGREDPLEEGTATHSSILAWSIPRTEEPGGLQSMGSQRVGMDQRIDITRSRHARTRAPGLSCGTQPQDLFLWLTGCSLQRMGFSGCAADS